MKKYMIQILMLCLGYAGMTRAANTDISTLDNIIYVEPFNAAAGTQVQMSIKMKNSAAIRGFQFDLFLPDGFTAAKTAKGKIIASLAESRLPDEDEHTLTLSQQGDGSIRFLCGSMADETFTGTDGEIATLTINVDGGIANGDYSVYLRTMKLTETDISKYYENEEIETTLTVGGKSYTVLDETSLTPPADATGVDVRVRRTIKANEWSTIVLPFAMNNTQLKAAFGDDVQLANFTSWSSEEDEYTGDITKISIGFTDVTALDANHPYIIKVSSPITEFTVDGVDIEVEEEPSVQVGTKKANRGYFTGTYVAQTEVPEENLFISGNQFWYSTGATKTKAFRGFFELADVLSDIENAGVKILFVVDDVATEIGAIAAETAVAKGVYTIQGTFLGDDIDINTLPKGMYIIDGKKVFKK